MAQAFNVKTESKKAYALFDTCSLRSCIREKCAFKVMRKTVRFKGG